MTEEVKTPEQLQAEAVADDAAFEAGFNEERETPPAKEPEKAIAGEPPRNPDGTFASAGETPPAAPAKDPWEGVPNVVRESLEGITNRLSALDRIDHRLKSTEGRVGAIQTALAAAKADTKQAGAAAPTQTQVTAAAASSEKWQELERDFPEWTAALNERLAVLNAELTGKFSAVNVDGIKQDVVNTVSPMLSAVKSEARELARIDTKHEGWEDTVKTKGFGDWLAKQPQETQALADSEKSADAIKLLDAYKASTTPAPATPDPAKQKQQQRLEQAVTPQGTARPTPPAISDDDAFESGFYGNRSAA